MNTLKKSNEILSSNRILEETKYNHFTGGKTIQGSTAFLSTLLPRYNCEAIRIMFDSVLSYTLYPPVFTLIKLREAK